MAKSLLVPGGVFLVGLFAQSVELHGTLDQTGGQPVLKTQDGEAVALEGVSDALKVLLDKRLEGMDLGVAGQRVGKRRFRIGPFNKKTMWVNREGKRYLITYWCPVCSIRAYTPGPCQCCQEYTELDLQEIH